MEPSQATEGDRSALIRLQQHIASSRPTGLLARLKWRFELRRAEGILEWEDRHREGAVVAGPWRRQVIGGNLLIIGLAAVRILFFSHHALTLGRAASVLGLGSGLALVLAACAIWYSPRVEAAAERQYQRWLQRARNLPGAPEQRPTLPSDSAV